MITAVISLFNFTRISLNPSLRYDKNKKLYSSQSYKTNNMNCCEYLRCSNRGENNHQNNIFKINVFLLIYYYYTCELEITENKHKIRYLSVLCKLQDIFKIVLCGYSGYWISKIKIYIFVVSLSAYTNTRYKIYFCELYENVY